MGRLSRKESRRNLSFYWQSARRVYRNKICICLYWSKFFVGYYIYIIITYKNLYMSIPKQKRHQLCIFYSWCQKLCIFIQKTKQKLYVYTETKTKIVYLYYNSSWRKQCAHTETKSVYVYTKQKNRSNYIYIIVTTENELRAFKNKKAIRKKRN